MGGFLELGDLLRGAYHPTVITLQEVDQAALSDEPVQERLILPNSTLPDFTNNQSPGDGTAWSIPGDIHHQANLVRPLYLAEYPAHLPDTIPILAGLWPLLVDTAPGVLQVLAGFTAGTFHFLNVHHSTTGRTGPAFVLDNAELNSLVDLGGCKTVSCLLCSSSSTVHAHTHYYTVT